VIPILIDPTPHPPERVGRAGPLNLRLSSSRPARQERDEVGEKLRAARSRYYELNRADSERHRLKLLRESQAEANRLRKEREKARLSAGRGALKRLRP
jgi:hypothetical protein